MFLDDDLYSYPDGNTGGEKKDFTDYAEQDKTTWDDAPFIIVAGTIILVSSVLEGAKNINSKIQHRNSLHIDVKGKVAETKSDIGLLLDYFNGVINDDSEVLGLGGKQFGPNDGKYYQTDMLSRHELVWEEGFESKTINDFHPDKKIEYEQYLMEQYNNLKLLEVKETSQLEVYSPGKGVKGVEFVRLNDKDSYILENMFEELDNLDFRNLDNLDFRNLDIQILEASFYFYKRWEEIYFKYRKSGLIKHNKIKELDDLFTKLRYRHGLYSIIEIYLLRSRN